MSKKQDGFFSNKNEWSKIKDDILQGYLPAYFQKLLTSRRPTYYVDGFAGKGKFEDGLNGSPLIAIDCIIKDGFKAEQKLALEFKKRLQQQYKYVIDFPIRLKSEHRPKYRMIHVSDHQDGCHLMADNMLRRTDKLFTTIQQEGQSSLFDYTDEVLRSVEGDIITYLDLEKMVTDFTAKYDQYTHLTVFEADFCNEYGVICAFSLIRDILSKMELSGNLEIVRTPERTKKGQKSSFWDEKSDHYVLIRRKH